MRFSRKRSGAVEATASPAEVAVLAHTVRDLLGLLSGGAEPGPDADPLEALVGLGPADAQPPDDPALSRLFPDAYRPGAFDGDGEGTRAAAAAQEFRRYTERDLRAGKRASADAVLETLAAAAASGRLRLDRDQVDAWLGTLNDVRLALGVRLGIEDDTFERDLPDDRTPEGAARRAALEVFAWLGWLQESLLECVEPRPS